jgi:hypothetical protein
MFMTWKIWKILRYPLRWHPIFRYTHTRMSQANQNSHFWRVPQFAAGLAILVFIIWFPVPALFTGLGLAVGIPTLILIFNGTFLGLYWVTEISDTLVQSYQDKRFDLLALTSRGALGVGWLICTATIHRGDWLQLSYRILRWVLFFVLVLVTLPIVGIILSSLSANTDLMRENQFQILLEVLAIAMIVFALWLDHIQSIVIASLLGVLMPSYLPQSWQLGQLARLVYLLIQVGTYLALAMIYILLQIVISSFLGTQIYSGLLHIGFTIFTFYMLRETLINLLWRSMLRHFDVSAKEFQQMVSA